jgi:hypothetical protein
MAAAAAAETEEAAAAAITAAAEAARHTVGAKMRALTAALGPHHPEHVTSS